MKLVVNNYVMDSSGVLYWVYGFKAGEVYMTAVDTQKIHKMHFIHLVPFFIQTGDVLFLGDFYDYTVNGIYYVKGCYVVELERSRVGFVQERHDISINEVISRFKEFI